MTRRAPSRSMHLLVGIDTEGDNQWDAARAREPAVREHLRAAAAACAVRAARRPADLRHHLSGGEGRAVGGRAARAAGGRRLRDRRASSRLGNAAVHGRGRPPASVRVEPAAARSSRQQLASLTDAIDARPSATRPVSYRSGRFGFSAAHVAALERLGYLVESSVAPLFYEAHKGGPDFVEAPLTPYFLAYDSATQAGHAATCSKCPCSAALNRRLPRRLQYLYARAPRPYTTKRVLRKLGHRARALAAAVVLVARRHDRARAAISRAPASRSSTSCSIRARRSSAAARTTGREAELDAFFDRLERFFAFATQELGAVPATFCRIQARVRRLRRPLTRYADPPRHAAPAAGPGGQRAAAVPARGLGARRAATSVEYIAHPPRAGTAAPLAGPVTWIPRQQRRIASTHAAPRDRLPARGASARARRAAIATRRRRARAQQRPAARKSVRGSRGAPGKPVVLTLYGTEIWHYQPKTSARSLHARVSRGRVVTFYSDRLLLRARELGLARRDCQVIYPPVGDRVRVSRRGRAARRAALRSASTQRHLLLNVKRLHPLAGQRFLLEAMPDVVREHPGHAAGHLRHGRAARRSCRPRRDRQASNVT